MARRGVLVGACVVAACTVFSAGPGSNLFEVSNARPQPAESLALSRNILVDQLGYLPNEHKVAVIRSPETGFDAGSGFVPGSRYEVRRVPDGHVMLVGTLEPWEGGRREASSGDKGWWFDFSALEIPGRYSIVDVERRMRSAEFNVGPHVYGGILKAATRMYYYQRSGFAKRAPFADACWRDEAAYDKPNQDREARDVTDRSNAAKIRDLSGGWFDAGDTNKYVTFALQPVHQLLNAYADNPSAFTDDTNIPESGNGIPDILDEIKWETDWLRKMQFADGSVALKVGEIEYGSSSPPSRDSRERYYVPACTSATIAASSMYAHAANIFKLFTGLEADALDLRRRAVGAWTNYVGAAVKQANCDTGIVHTANADLSIEAQGAVAAEAAIYLFALTGEAEYDAYLKSHYRELRPYRDVGWSRYLPDQGEALLFYTTLANADPALKSQILKDKLADMQNGQQIYRFHPADDLYRAYLQDSDYVWGSHNVRANYGNSNLDAIRYRIADKDSPSYRERALGILHYFHGVNPFGLVYLTNAGSLGATRSVNEIYHSWFMPNTRWSNVESSPCGPAPGYLPGGPNASATRDGVPADVVPPSGQPPQKSYRESNRGTPENAWVVNEPAIYYQSAYVKLLSAFAR